VAEGYDAFVRKTLALLTPLAVPALLWNIAEPNAAWVEWVYTSTIFPVVTAVIVPISDLFPFSLSLILLFLLPVVLTGALVRSYIKRSSFRSWLGRTGVHGAGICLVLYSMFLLNWGANYSRQPIEQLLSLPHGPIESTEVEALTRQLVKVIVRDLPEAEQRDTRAALASIRASLQNTVQSITGTRPVLPRHVKRLPDGWLLSMRVSGVASPLLLEAHVDGALPDHAFLAVAAHELAHVAGFAGEADTDLVAALAGLHADHPYARYAVALWLYGQTSRQLSIDVRAELRHMLPEQALADLQATREASKRHYNPASARVSEAVYNQYLIAQRIEAGIRDYSRIVTLLTLAERTGHVFERSWNEASEAHDETF
jgi:hypothetical protein